jgi:hypothetical protein
MERSPGYFGEDRSRCEEHCTFCMIPNNLLFVRNVVCIYGKYGNHNSLTQDLFISSPPLSSSCDRQPGNVDF